MESDGKSGDSRAHTWSTFNVVIMYVAVIVLTSPMLGNAATTVPPFRSTSFNVRTSTSAMEHASPLVAGSRLSRFGNAPADAGSRLPDELESLEGHRGDIGAARSRQERVRGRQLPPDPDDVLESVIEVPGQQGDFHVVRELALLDQGRVADLHRERSGEWVHLRRGELLDVHAGIDFGEERVEGLPPRLHDQVRRLRLRGFRVRALDGRDRPPVPVPGRHADQRRVLAVREEAFQRARFAEGPVAGPVPFVVCDAGRETAGPPRPASDLE